MIKIEVSKLPSGSSSCAVWSSSGHLCACSLTEGQKHCTAALLSEGKVVPPTHILSSLTLPLLLRPQELQYKQVFLCCCNIKAGKGCSDQVVWGTPAGSSQVEVFAPSTPQPPWLQVQGDTLQHTHPQQHGKLGFFQTHINLLIY